MNRGTALLLAMAALLAHALAIHSGADQDFAAPYDLAHVAYRVGRNFVQHGELAFNVAPLEGGLESYGSPLLVGLAALAERTYLPVTTFCQTLGVLACLTAASISATFATDRFAGVIPPVLLVASGCFAAAAASGTELPFLALFATLAFVAMEHRWHRRFAVGLAGLVLSSPLGVPLALCLFALALSERAVPRQDGSPPMPIGSAVPAMALAALFFALRTREGESLYGSLLERPFAFDPQRMREGLAYVRDFAVATVLPFLLAVPLLCMLFGRLSGAGLRAMFLTLVWILLIVLQGGGPLAFSVAMAPTLPLLCIAIQQGMLAALDTHRRTLEVTCWSVLALAVGGSALASKYPGDLGPLPMYAVHQQWMTASARAPWGHERVLGRQALDDELLLTATLRHLGTFLRAQDGAQRTLLTPWPGATAYLSGMRVIDLLGRATRVPGLERAGIWEPRPKTDVVALLEARPDYVLPSIITRYTAVRTDFAMRLLLELNALDIEPSPVRLRRLDALLDEYELVTLPLRPGPARAARPMPFYILRRRELGLSPRLNVTLANGMVRVDALPFAAPGSEEGAATGPLGAPQLAWLQVRIVDDRGRTWSLDPHGRPTQESRMCARTNLLIEPRAGRPTRLAELALPKLEGGALPSEVRALLINPSTRRSHALARLGDEAVLEIVR